jgi:hypothetical protein
LILVGTRTAFVTSGGPAIRTFFLGAVALAAAAGGVYAQTTSEPAGSAVLEFTVFDPAASAWVSSMTAQPGQQVEWRMDVRYAGTRTDLYALGNLRFQVVVENADNAADTNGVDDVGIWRGSPQDPCTVHPCPPIDQTNARLGMPLPSYGCVNYTPAPLPPPWPIAIPVVFRHSGGSGGAPAGEWMRMAYSSATVWPTATSSLTGSVGWVQSSQALQPSGHVPGLAPTVFRQAHLLSAASDARVLSISVVRHRTSYISWQTGPADNGSHRTMEPTIVPAFVFITGSACDSIDLIRDTIFPDLQDITDFVGVFAGGPCPTPSCNDIDFNNDGAFPDTEDIESLVSVFAGGACL